MSPERLAELIDQARRFDRRAIGRLVSLFESTGPRRAATRKAADELLRAGAHRGVFVGFTGSPGAGKSSLIAAVVERVLARTELRVAVLAVDPSSTISGGSLLGDRTRMRFAETERLFVRSQAAGGALGGLSLATFGACRALQHLFDLIVVETVGVGQSESAIRSLVSRLYLVTHPHEGDRLQLMKAGLMELPDVIVLNKSDLRAANQRAATLRSSSELTGANAEVFSTSVVAGTGLDELAEDLVKVNAGATRGCDHATPAFLRQWALHEYGAAGARKLESLPGFAENRLGFEDGMRALDLELQSPLQE